MGSGWGEKERESMHFRKTIRKTCVQSANECIAVSDHFLFVCLFVAVPHRNPHKKWTRNDRKSVSMIMSTAMHRTQCTHHSQTIRLFKVKTMTMTLYHAIGDGISRAFFFDSFLFFSLLACLSPFSHRNHTIEPVIWHKCPSSCAPIEQIRVQKCFANQQTTITTTKKKRSRSISWTINMNITLIFAIENAFRRFFQLGRCTRNERRATKLEQKKKWYSTN